MVSVTSFAALVAPTTVVPNVRDAGETLTFVASGLTVRPTVVVFVKLPDTPVIVIVEDPNAAELLAVKVSVLVVVVEVGLKTAVTPVGRPEALKLTLPVKPLPASTVMVLVTVPPGATFTKLGLAVKLKPPTTFTSIVFDGMPLAMALTL